MAGMRRLHLWLKIHHKLNSWTAITISDIFLMSCHIKSSTSLILPHPFAKLAPPINYFQHSSNPLFNEHKILFKIYMTEDTCQLSNYYFASMFATTLSSSQDKWKQSLFSMWWYWNVDWINCCLMVTEWHGNWRDSGLLIPMYKILFATLHKMLIVRLDKPLSRGLTKFVMRQLYVAKDTLFP